MSLLAIELVLGAVAIKRGWRVAPILLIALPFVVRAFEPALVGLLGPQIGDYFDPAGTSRALAHGLALVALVVTCWTDPAEVPAAVARVRARPTLRRTGPLYQI